MDSYHLLPKLPGVYLFENDRGEVIYIGKAKSLRDRVSSYFSGPLFPKTAQLVSQIAKINHIVTESEIDALILETNQIQKYLPHFNVNLKDGKTFPYIEITIKDQIPQVHSMHGKKNPNALYFGPYPTGSDINSLLRFLRRIFPYVSQNHPGNRPCLRSHLGLCPCQNLKPYKQNLNNLIAFLSGRRQSVKKKLTRQMQELAKNQFFEEAGQIKKQLDQIAWVTAPRTPALEYQINPNLTADRRTKELLDLRRLLRLPALQKIECFDISNTSGQLATAAQVTFVNGEPDKNLYRRYRLKKLGADTDMMKEIIARRLKSDIPLPELIVIDGGKEHLQWAPVPVIGLAKRLETIYYNNKVIQLSKSAPALHLLQRLRDEAHRFSRRYHFLLRRKKMLT